MSSVLPLMEQLAAELSPLFPAATEELVDDVEQYFLPGPGKVGPPAGSPCSTLTVHWHLFLSARTFHSSSDVLTFCN